MKGRGCGPGKDREECTGETVEVKVQRLEHHAGLPLPEYRTALASGMDLHAALSEPLTIQAGGWAVVPTGIRVALPPGIEGQVRPRSGLAASHGVTVLNAPGTIDADYRGEIKVLLVNLGQMPYVVRRGDRVAQLVLQRVVRGRLTLSDELERTQRDEGGFGHTGR
ncbi:MAG: dUTP diphosphatase [Thermodesulfobacteriota bacterium]